MDEGRESESRPEAHVGFAERVVARAPAVPGLLAVAAAGSWADGRLDELSDLDLVIVTQPGVLVAEADRRQLAEDLGSLRAAIVGTHVGQPRLLLCLYADPILHVDLLFVEAPDLPALGQGVSPLYLSPDASDFEWPEARKREPLSAQWCEDRAWLSLHYLTSKTARGELHEAISGLAWFRSSILCSLIARVHGLPPLGFRRLEQTGIPELESLARTHPSYHRQAIVTAIRESFTLYLELRDRAGDEVLVNRAAEHDMRAHFQEQFGPPLVIDPAPPSPAGR